MPIAAKVNAFENKVGGYERVAVWAYAEDGRIVSDAADDHATSSLP